MPKTLVLFYSRTGNTARLADAIAEGVREVRFAEVDVRRIDDLTPTHVIEGDATWKAERERLAGRYPLLESADRLADYDAIVLGAPARYGAMAAELKTFFDQAGALAARGALLDKVGSAFTSVATPQDGRHHTLWSMLVPMASLGLILVPPGYADPAAKGGTPYDAMATPRHHNGPIDADLAVARQQGRRVATVAGWIRHAKSHHHH